MKHDLEVGRPLFDHLPHGAFPGLKILAVHGRRHLRAGLHAQVIPKENDVNMRADGLQESLQVAKVDFRELVRDLAAALRSRIELWQIGVRDEAREIDGFGICGCRLCCSAYIKEFQPVTIRMAKNQDIFLSPSKLSGCCGRLMCCLAYEESDYIEMAKNAASVGAYVKGEGFEGLVVERNLIAGTYVVRDDKENRQTIKHELIREIRAPEGPMEPMPYAGAPDEDDPGDAAAENGSDA